MLKFLDAKLPFRLVWLLGLVIVAAGAWLKFFAIGNGLLSDPFHYGEYFASATTLANSATSIYPITIHGALDYLPSMLAALLHDTEHHFLTTMLLYQSGKLLATLLFYALVVLIAAPLQHYRIPILLLVVATLTGTQLVGYKDLFLLLSLFLFFLGQQQMSLSRRTLLEVGLGLAVALNLFWSFDRGIAGTVAIGVAVLIEVYYARRYWVALVTFFIAVPALALSSEIFSLGQYIENIRFLMNTSSQWSYGWAWRPVALTLLLASAYLAILAHLFIIRQRPWRFDESWAVPILFSLLMLFVFKITTNRADLPHLSLGFWTPVLTLLYVLAQQQAAQWKHKVIALVILASSLALLIYVGRNALTLLATAVVMWLTYFTSSQGKIQRRGIMAIALLLLLWNLAQITMQVSNKNYGWIQRLDPLPHNESLTSDGIRWVAAELRRHHPTCLFDLANHGVINGLSKLPTCTRFTYITYASADYETEIIQSLQKKNPPLIISSSNYKQFKVDGKGMNERFPNLHHYLVERYPYEQCNFGYCLRYLSSPYKDVVL